MSEDELASAAPCDQRLPAGAMATCTCTSLNLKAMHEGNTLILYYLSVEKPMVMNTRGRPMPLYNTR